MNKCCPSGGRYPSRAQDLHSGVKGIWYVIRSELITPEQLFVELAGDHGPILVSHEPEKR
jgi:hypothetical protein